MLIGELSQKTGLSRDTIRFYEKQGLVLVGRKERRDNNYKEYSADTLYRLLMVKRLKGFGFTLNEIIVLLQAMEEDAATCGNVSQQMQDKITLIDAKIKELEETKVMILGGLDGCKTTCSGTQETANCGFLSQVDVC
jgi:DNA-binding transcriptional MerR regulator